MAVSEGAPSLRCVMDERRPPGEPPAAGQGPTQARRSVNYGMLQSGHAAAHAAARRLGARSQTGFDGKVYALPGVRLHELVNGSQLLISKIPILLGLRKKFDALHGMAK